MPYPDLRSRLEAIMRERGLSARAISLRAKMNPTAVRDILSGKSANPRTETILRLAQALNVDVGILLEGKTVDEIWNKNSEIASRLGASSATDVDRLFDVGGFSPLLPNLDQMTAAPNFTRARLRGANFAGADLRGAVFIQADLREANFYRANLIGSSLSQAQLNGANFNEADLRDAILIEAIVEDAVFIGAKLEGAVLDGVDLRKAMFGGSVPSSS